LNGSRTDVILSEAKDLGEPRDGVAFCATQ
jgi:hypothetical protein